MPSEVAIQTSVITKRFGSALAVDGASVEVPHGSITALVGPSGSGKTTLLRIVAGFEAPDSGTVRIGGRTVVSDEVWIEPEERRVGMVFQHGALFPHLTVARNVGFGNPAAGRVEECLDLVGLRHRSDAYPHELSGGERQRVALARALATEPEVVLMDEPFGSLDAALRVTLREQVASILRDAGATALLVTHDQQEALSLADQVVLLRAGRVEQAGPPEEVYARPTTAWAAQFLGAADVVTGAAGDGVVDCELGRFEVAPGLSGEVAVVVRPEVVRMSLEDTADGTRAVVVGRSYFGHEQLVDLELDSGQRVRSRIGGTTPCRLGDEVRLRVEGPVGVLPSP